MAKRASKAVEFGWFTANQLAVIFGWKSDAAFRATWRGRMPAEAVLVAAKGTANLYHAATLHRLICEAQAAQAIERAGGDPDLIGGGDSPALEKLRAAKAAIAELDLGKRRGELVERSAVQAMAALACVPLQKALEAACPTCSEMLRKRAGEFEGAFLG